MFATRLFLLGALVLLGKGGESSDVVDGAKPSVLRVHSLAGLSDYVRSCDRTLPMLPYRMGSHTETPGIEGEDQALFMASEDVVMLIRELVEAGSWDDGARIDVVPGNRLVVFAPPETQEKVAEFLSRLVTAFVTTEQLEVRVLSGAPDQAGSLLVDPATADQQGEGKVIRRANVALHGTAVVGAQSIDTQTVPYDWDIEIAQGATIADPIVIEVATGLKLIVRATRLEKATAIALVLDESEQAAEDQMRRPGAQGLINAKPVMAERIAAGLMQHPCLSFISLAGTFVVPDGKALLLPLTIQTHLGTITYCLDLRVTGATGNGRLVLDLPARGEGGGEGGEGGDRRFVMGVVGLSHLNGPEIPALPSRLFDHEWINDGTGFAWVSLGGEPTQGDLPLDNLRDLASTLAGPAAENGECMLNFNSNVMMMELPRQLSEKVEAALASVCPIESVRLGGRVLDGEGNARAEFQVPMVLGRQLALWGGIQGTRIADWDVDVANEAQMPNVEVEAWVDGFALRVEITRDAAGRLQVHASTKLNFLKHAPSTQELQDFSRLTIDKIEAQRCFLDEMRTLPAQGGAVILGGGDLRLELNVKTR